MSMKEMWKYLQFQTKGYRIVEIAIILGAISGAITAYLNSILYARIMDALILRKYERGIQLTIIMVITIWVVNMIYSGCNQLFEHFAAPCMDETKKRTARKAFMMEYEELEKEETLNAFRRVRIGEQSSGSIYDQLKWIFQLFKEAAKIVFAFVFLVMLVMQASFSNQISMWKIGMLTVLLVAFFAGTLYLNYKISGKIGERQVSLNRENERTNSKALYLFNIIHSESCAKDFKLNQMEEYLFRKLYDSTNTTRLYTTFGIYAGKMNGLLSFILQMFAGFIYVYVVIIALSGTITTGEVLMYAGAIITMMTSIQSFLSFHQFIQYSNEYLQSYEEFIQKPDMNYEGCLPIEKRDDNRYELSFQNVSFRYPGTDLDILKNINMTFQIGQKVALVGLNGAGKTTLIKLLLRFYEPTEGKICLNGIDISKYDYDEYMRIFSVVFQDFSLFDFPLDENIAGSEVLNQDKLNHVIEKMGLTSLVDSLPDKEHTLLYHENGDGVSLSGGEAQKVAIARALYKDAPFVILDEPTAALDPIAEAEVYEKFDDLVGEKTSIYISHRMSSCKFCDRIIVLDHGEVKEEGDHASLLSFGGIYANLYQTQATYYQ